MEWALTNIASPAAVAALVAGALWGPATGHPTWLAASRGRLASSVAVSVAVAWLVFSLVRRIGVLAAG